MEDQRQQKVGVEASRCEESSEGNIVVMIDMPTGEEMNKTAMVCGDMELKVELNSSSESEKTEMESSKSQALGLADRIQPHGYSHDNLKSPKDAYLSARRMEDQQQQEVGVGAIERNIRAANLRFPRVNGSGLTLCMAREDLKMIKDRNALSESEETEIGSSKSQALRLTDRIQPHGYYHDNLKSLKDAYLSIIDDISAQRNSRAPASDQGRGLHENDIFQQQRPLRSTVLHIAASYANDDCVEEIVKRAPHLLSAKNANGDTALHVAAKAGHLSTLKRLLAAHLRSLHRPYSEIDFLDEILEGNNQGNTFFHEAILNGHQGVMYSLLSDEEQFEVCFKELVVNDSLVRLNKENKSVLYMAIEAGYKEFVGQALDKLNKYLPDLAKSIQHINVPGPSPNLDSYNYVPSGKSPLLAAILKKDRDILDTILAKQPKWIHLRDEQGSTPLHYAASIGYFEGIQYLLGKCASCASERDTYGFSPLHLASDGGHLEVVQELLKPEYCPDPREMLDNAGRNILHLAAQSGKFKVVRYILKAANHEIGEMVNDKDADGNTPLHLATLRCHPKIVHALTWDNRVKLHLVNGKNETAIGACGKFQLENPSLRQRLTWIALKSAGVPSSGPEPSSIKVPPQSSESLWKQKAPNTDQYKDRINTLMLVSTLIITVTFAAGFTLPGGTNSSDPGRGMALMLNHLWFKLFIFCNTVSMYGAISVTIVLVWAQLGDIALALLALEVTRPLLGVTLATLSLAFLAGVHLVISDISWLATTFLVACVIFIFVILLLYILLWFPSSSSVPVVRYISYYPFLFFAWLVERDEAGSKPHGS